MREDLTCLAKYILSDGVGVRPTKIIFSSLRKLLISPFLSDSKSYSEPKCQSLSMAASSSSNPCNSNPTPCWKYHVFLSFRGEDTRCNFTDHLYDALCRKGIITFRDDKELERGEVIKHELFQAIDESLCSVVIISQNYASSCWCLDELQKILECRKVLGRGVLPIFYGIDPSIVRYQTGSFAEAFRKHEERFGKDRTKVQRWRDALSEIANLSGCDSRNQHEAKFIDEIITVLWRKLKPEFSSYFNDGLVGIDAKLEDIYKILEIGSAEVRFVGIWGMGGIGKTILAKLVFNQFRSHFDTSCCLENVREKSTIVDGLLGLQLKLLSSLEIKILEIDNLDQGKATIRKLLSQRKVLLLLDDLDDIRQLEHLAGKQDWFGQGSRVIVTTRDMHLLESHEAPFSKYKIRVLNTNEALHLFCQKAFKRNRPKEGYKELSKTLVQYCQGLPLALKVLGSHLGGRDHSVWEDAFKKIRKDPPKDILDTLSISFEGLEEAEKTIFLDIACFFKGWDIDRVMQILEISSFNPKIGIEILIERSLLTCDGRIFQMHDLLQEMGRKIVVKNTGNEISKQSRLWSIEDIDEVLGKNKGTEFIQGIVLGTHNSEACWALGTHNYEARWDPKAFSKLCNLRVFIISHGLQLQLPLGLKCLSNSIKVLEWWEYPLQSLPHGVKLEKLIELKLHGSKIKQLWNGSQNFENLRFIDLSYSKYLTHTPNFFGVPNLESLILEGCSNLVKIHHSVGLLKKLVVLNLKDCINLKYLPRQLETNCLKDVNLCGCSKVQKLHEFVENMKENKSLERLDLSETAIKEVPSLDGGFQNLKWLSVRGCRGPISKPWWEFLGYSIPMGLKLPPLSGLQMLKELDASYCNLSAESIPDINCLTSLEILRLSGNNFSRNSILMRWKFSQFSGLLKLKELELNNCSLNDESIPDDLSYLPSLEQITLCGNNFVNLPPGCISSLTCLQNLKLNSCSKLQTLPVFPPSLRCVLARNCGPITPLPETQIWKMISSAKFVAVRGIIPGNEIPAWFDKQEDFPSFWRHGQFQDSIIVDIPDCCWSSEWCGIVFCFIVEPPNNADLNGEIFLAEPEWDLWCNLATLEANCVPSKRYGYRLEVDDYRGFIRNHQFTLVLDCNFVCGNITEDGGNHQPEPRRFKRDGGNRRRLYFGFEHDFWKDNFVSSIEKLNIRKCGWRVICENEMQSKVIMSGSENISSDSSGFNESRLIEM